MPLPSRNQCLVLGASALGAYFLYRAVRPRYDFRGKHVLITGGSRGLGLVLARELAARGTKLSICARTPEELAAAFDELSRRTAVVAAQCDVTDPVRAAEFVSPSPAAGSARSTC